MILRPGEVVPADAVILASKVFFVSQAPLTGEAIPVGKYSNIEKKQMSGNNIESSAEKKDEKIESDVEKMPSQEEVHKPISKFQRFFMVIFGMKVSAESQLDKDGNILREDLSSPEHVWVNCILFNAYSLIYFDLL